LQNSFFNVEKCTARSILSQFLYPKILESQNPRNRISQFNLETKLIIPQMTRYYAQFYIGYFLPKKWLSFHKDQYFARFVYVHGHNNN